MEGVADKWMSVGLLLGISYKILQICELSDTLDEKVNGVVEAWLGKKYDVESFGEASWRKLVEVVASRAGGCHQALAAKIARQHPIVNGTSLYSVYSPSLYDFEWTFHVHVLTGYPFRGRVSFNWNNCWQSGICMCTCGPTTSASCRYRKSWTAKSP